MSTLDDPQLAQALAGLGDPHGVEPVTDAAAIMARALLPPGLDQSLASLGLPPAARPAATAQDIWRRAFPPLLPRLLRGGAYGVTGVLLALAALAPGHPGASTPVAPPPQAPAAEGQAPALASAAPLPALAARPAAVSTGPTREPSEASTGPAAPTRRAAADPAPAAVPARRAAADPAPAAAPPTASSAAAPAPPPPPVASSPAAVAGEPGPTLAPEPHAEVAEVRQPVDTRWAHRRMVMRAGGGVGGGLGFFPGAVVNLGPELQLGVALHGPLTGKLRPVLGLSLDMGAIPNEQGAPSRFSSGVLGEGGAKVDLRRVRLGFGWAAGGRILSRAGSADARRPWVFFATGPTVDLWAGAEGKPGIVLSAAVLGTRIDLDASGDAPIRPWLRLGIGVELPLPNPPGSSVIE